MNPSSTCGWHGTFEAFLEAPVASIVEQLEDFIGNPSADQRHVWQQTVETLQPQVQKILEERPTTNPATNVLELHLAMEARRSDAILLLSGHVLVLEFKSASTVGRAAIDQVRAYARDLTNYHRVCYPPRPVHAVLVPGPTSKPTKRDGVVVTPMNGLAKVVLHLTESPASPPLVGEEFLAPDAYSPLPSLVEAARELFNQKRIREVWKAKADTDRAIEAVSEIAREAAATRTRHLVLVTGIPGSGKTLVGLRLAHASFLDDLAVERKHGKPSAPAVFLSGNGPLVQVLQYLLREAGGDGKTFVRGVKDYVGRYAGSREKTPEEHVLIFDEAQRAWDREQVSSKHQAEKWGAEKPKSEPEHFVDFAERIPQWAVLVGLIGGGQEIHVGEEAGIQQWRRALEGSNSARDWTVHAPSDHGTLFAGGEFSAKVDDRLNLNREVRFHLVPHVEDFVAALLEGHEAQVAREHATRLQALGYSLLVTRDLEEAKAYARDRYADDPEARFGLVASARDKDLEARGIAKMSNLAKHGELGKFFADGEESSGSCRRLSKAVTEFDCQGLELDLAILCWGTDLVRRDAKWSNAKARPYRLRKPMDPFQLRLNSYRVLLTRGRDGVVLYAPRSPMLDETYEWLLGCGFSPIGMDEAEQATASGVVPGST
jgi:hypothetical protein